MSEKTLTPTAKAKHTGRWAETMFRALTKRVGGRWRFVSFRGAKGGESRGVVDVLGIRRRMSPSRGRRFNMGDVFDFVLIQLKGGEAREPSQEDIDRLRSVARHLRANAIVLYSWKRGKRSIYKRLNRRGNWVRTTAAKVFR